MEKRTKEIIRAVEKKDYFVALLHINSAYNILYREKVNFSRLHAGKNFAQIANTDCPKIKKWHEIFSKFEDCCGQIINKIQNESEVKEAMFINVEGEDLYLKMTRKRNHCKLFANKRKLSLK